MENSHQKGAAEFKILDGQKTDFNLIFANFSYLVNKALELLKKDPTNFILAFAIPVVVGGILSAVVLPMFLGGLMTGGMAGGLVSLAVYIFCGIILSLVAYIALLKAIVDVSKGGKVNIVDVFKFGFSKCINFIILDIKAFLIIFTGGWNFINSLLSPIYFVENGGKIDDSIKSSQATVKGKSITLIWAMVLVGLITGLVSSIAAQIWMNIFWRISFDLAEIGMYIINGVVTPFAVICHYVLRAELEKHAGHNAAPVHHAPTHQA